MRESQIVFEPSNLGSVVVFVAMAIPVLVIDQILFMAIRPVLSFNDEAYDERQAALVANANGRARYSALLFLAALTMVGVAQFSPKTIGYLGLFFMKLGV